MNIEGRIKDFSILEDRVVIHTNRGMFVLYAPDRVKKLDKLLSQQRRQEDEEQEGET